MVNVKKATWTILICIMCISSYAEQINRAIADTVPAKQWNKKLNWITPTFLFATGMSIATIPSIRKIDTVVNNGFNTPRKHTKIDDYTQYLPAVAVFALDATGLKGKYSPKQQLVLYGLSNITTAVVVQSMKRIIGRERPYGNEFNAFPSGHTSTAFAAAEFLHQEYGHYSPWVSVAGYVTASATGYMRLYNNQHWLGDVLAGAAIGMASTKMIYWLKKKKRPKGLFKN